MAILIETEHLVLRDVLDSDFDDVHALFADRRVHQSLGAGSLPSTPAQARDVVTRYANEWQQRDRVDYTFAIVVT